MQQVDHSLEKCTVVEFYMCICMGLDSLYADTNGCMKRRNSWKRMTGTAGTGRPIEVLLRGTKHERKTDKARPQQDDTGAARGEERLHHLHTN